MYERTNRFQFPISKASTTQLFQTVFKANVAFSYSFFFNEDLMRMPLAVIFF